MGSAARPGEPPSDLTVKSDSGPLILSGHEASLSAPRPTAHPAGSTAESESIFIGAVSARGSSPLAICWIASHASVPSSPPSPGNARLPAGGANPPPANPPAGSIPLVGGGRRGFARMRTLLLGERGTVVVRNEGLAREAAYGLAVSRDRRVVRHPSLHYQPAGRRRVGSGCGGKAARFSLSEWSWPG